MRLGHIPKLSTIQEGKIKTIIKKVLFAYLRMSDNPLAASSSIPKHHVDNTIRKTNLHNHYSP